jgi:hypothetical protein
VIVPTIPAYERVSSRLRIQPIYKRDGIVALDTHAKIRGGVRHLCPDYAFRFRLARSSGSCEYVNLLSRRWLKDKVCTNVLSNMEQPIRPAWVWMQSK